MSKNRKHVNLILAKKYAIVWKTEKPPTKTTVCSWAKLWPSLDLLQAYKKKAESDSQSQNGTDIELNELIEAMIEQLVDETNNLTTADINAWLEEADKQGQIMTEEIIADVLANSEEEEGGGMEETVLPQSLHTVTRIQLCAFTTAITWLPLPID
ncbi:hypothetical protein J6590_056039 [Homalodisca vitripennis]|nr:hypothetical protein J6590_056039 [Homalodisca vitripennis]